MAELPNDELRDVLRNAAEEHQPDHDAMFARVTEQRNAPARPVSPLTRLRPVAAVLAVLAVALLGGLGAWTAVKSVDRGGDDRVTVPAAAAPGPTTSASTPATTVTPRAKATSTASPSARPRTASPPSSPAPPVTVDLPSGSAPEKGFLWSDGSVAPESTDTQGRSNITLKNQRTMTTVEVTIRIALTDGLADAGGWSTMPAANYTVTVHRVSGALYYHFVVNSGVKLVPGTYVFTAQYNHAEGERDANDDAYLATADAGGTHARVYGNFAPTH